MLRHLPSSTNPDLLVGFDTNDDAGVFIMQDGQAIVQTVDFFTPIVDDPYAYGLIAAANALSDVYAMGAKPLTVLNIACFDPDLAPPEVWSEILRGMYDKTTEAGAVVAGGHTILDPEPKFGLSVTGIADPEKVFRTDFAQPGDEIWLTKPLGTGVITTAAMNDKCSDEELQTAVDSMSMLNKHAAEEGLLTHCYCATDVTGFGLAGHMFNICRASSVSIEIDAAALPIFPGVERLIGEGCLTAGGSANRSFLADNLEVSEELPDWMTHLVVDPQSSGGLALIGRHIGFGAKIGRVAEGPPKVIVR